VTVAPGWQLVTLPFSQFSHNANELALDPGSLTDMTFTLVAGMGTSFSFCIHDVSFY
jgi:hypothetical protein